MLILSILAVPVLGVLALMILRLIFPRSNKYHAAISVITSAVVLVLAYSLLIRTINQAPVTFKIPLYGPFSPCFYVDLLSCVLVVLAAFLWFAVSIYAPKYIVHEGKTTLFYISTLATLFAVLGVFLAGDLFTMLLFFEIMTVSSYFWVVHRWDKSAIKAGYFYLFFSMVGGFIITLGMVLMGAATQTLPTIGTIVSPLNPALFNWSIILFVVGFGIKAGMVPLHIWLPRAHSSAPTPGSALLSGLLIKVGAYGLIRVIGFVGFGTGAQTMAGELGTVISVLGAASMLIGVIAALLQSDAKRLLAYHSVSQMGYIILSIGIALYLGNAGGLSLIGAIYHMINHALFKSALFLGVGIIYIRMKEINLYKLGALLKKFPILAALMFFAVLGIIGIPGLNGYASKTLMHHGLNIAVEGKETWPKVIEKLFSLVGVGTAASFTKLYYLAFIKKTAIFQVGKVQSLKKTSSDAAMNKEFKNIGLIFLYLPMALLVVAMLVIGIAPKLLLNRIITPAACALGMQNALTATADFAFWNFSDIISTFITLALGMLICWGGLKIGAFHWHAPSWLTIEGLSKLVFQGVCSLCQKGALAYHHMVMLIIKSGKAAKASLFSAFHALTHRRNYTIGKTTLIGISADAALLMLMLLLLIAGYTVGNFNLGMRVSSFLSLLWRGQV
jgi:hydrogenase-4 component B